MKKTIYIIFCLFALKANAQTDTTAKKNIADTLKKDLFTAPDTVQHLHSKTRSLIPPAVLIGYGISSFYIRPVRRVDESIYNEAVAHKLFITSHVEDYFQYAPVVLTYGLNLVGVHGKNTFIDRTLTYVMAQGMMNLVLYTVKHSTHRLRPDGSDHLSFPSGHTSNAFSGAEFMSQELSGKSVGYGILGYALATTTGIFRVYHEDHWFSDVVAGAGVGILATKGAYLLYPYVRNALFNGGTRDKQKNLPPELKKNNSKSTILLPSYQDGAIGLQFAMQL